MPWVRLHGTKDYADMAALIGEFPALRVTVNLVPSLVEQIEDVSNGRGADPWEEAARQPAAALSRETRRFLLRSFFHANPRTMIAPFPRYAELWAKRGEDLSDDGLDRAAAAFFEGDWRDLQVAFHLAWTDPRWIREDASLAALAAKGRDWTEDDKRVLFDAQRAIVARILPLYRQLSDRGQIEISTSPYFHPILPLLIDSDSAIEAMPGRTLPAVRIQAREDADAQLRWARDKIGALSGRPPAGLWPSEGSVSDATAEAAAAAGFRWLASDEEVLAASLSTVVPRDPDGHVVWPDLLYRPYALETPAGRIHAVFRDHVLSDLVGFVYHRWRPEDAAADFLARLKRIHDSTRGRPALVTVILDGENAWEHYDGDGEPFLRALYGAISSQEWLKTVTVSEFLGAYGAWSVLPHLFAGSWISHNFAIWIGHPEDHRAWEELWSAREAWRARRGSDPAFEGSSAGSESLRCLYAAEGSDWMWWYGEEHPTPQKDEFDRLFRRYLLRVWELVGREPPDTLQRPLHAETERVVRLPYAMPVLDGSGLAAGWDARVLYDAAAGSGGAMHRSAGLIGTIAACADRTRLYLRIAPAAEGALDGRAVEIRVVSPRTLRIIVPPDGRGPVRAAVLIRAGEASFQWIAAGGEGADAVRGKVLEMAIPLAELGAKADGVLRLFVRVRKDGRIEERLPDDGLLDLVLPEAI